MRRDFLYIILYIISIISALRQSRQFFQHHHIFICCSILSIYNLTRDYYPPLLAHQSIFFSGLSGIQTVGTAETVAISTFQFGRRRSIQSHESTTLNILI